MGWPRDQELVSVAWSIFHILLFPYLSYGGRQAILVCSCVTRELASSGVMLPVGTDSLVEGEKLRGRHAASHVALTWALSPSHPSHTARWQWGLHSHRDPRDSPREAACSLSSTDAPWPWYFADKTMGVFHLQSPRKKYGFTYEQAQAACAAEGASLATFQQLAAAQQVRTGGQRWGRGWLHRLTWAH